MTHVHGSKLLIMMLLVSLLVGNSFASGDDPIVKNQHDDWVAHFRFLVKAAPGIDEAELTLALSGVNCTVLHKYAYNNWYSVRFPSGDVDQNFDTLASLVEVEIVNYDHVFSPNQYTPAEALFVDQWTLQETDGQSANANVQEAWSFTRGSRATGIFLLDSGFPDLEHTDWDDYFVPPNFLYDYKFPVMNPPGTSYINFAPQGEPNLWPYSASIDILGHATAMGGIIAAEHDGTELTGIAPETYIVCANFMAEFSPGVCPNPVGFYSSALEAMEWVLEWNANENDQFVFRNPPNDLGPIRVINASFSEMRNLNGGEDALYEFVENQLAAADILLIASGGHDDSPPDPFNGRPPMMGVPARWSGVLSNVLAVNAFERDGTHAIYSNWQFPDPPYHPGVFLGGPGGTNGYPDANGPWSWPCRGNNSWLYDAEDDVLVDWLGHMFFYWNDGDNGPTFTTNYYAGSSVATAHVSGIAGLVLAINPDLTAQELRDILLESCRIGDERNGAGRVNALRAVLRTPGTKTLEYNLTIPTWGVYIVDEVIVPSGITLTFAPGSSAVFAPGARIVVEPGGEILANGSEQARIHLTSTSQNPEDAWGGIIIESPVSSYFDNCLFENASCAVRVLHDGVAHVQFSEFENCGVGVAALYGGTLSLSACEIANCRYYGALAAARGSLEFDGFSWYLPSTITNCSHAGIWSASMAQTNLNVMWLEGNGPVEVSERQLIHGGIRSTYSNLDMNCVTSTVNHGPGLSVWGGTVIMAWQMEVSGRNVISENEPWSDGQTQIQFCTANVEMCAGRNKISAEEGMLIMDCDPEPEDVFYNNWGTGVDPAGRIPASYAYDPRDENSASNRCDVQPEYGPCDWSEPAEWFHQGWMQENSLQFAAAILSYKYIIDHYEDSKEVKLCPDRILFCEGKLEKDWTSYREYFLSVADTTTSDELKFSAKTAAAWCLVEMDEFEQAETELQALMDQSTNDYEYHKAALSSLLAELATAPWDTLGLFRNSGGRRGSGSTDQAEHAVAADPLLSTMDRMEAVLLSSKGSGSHALWPERYALHQNYPNPFNPLTEIRFDLPEKAHVELIIFNTLGQRVATLIDEPRVAGTYRVQWDGSHAASGVYLYCLKVGNFVATRKMILMK